MNATKHSLAAELLIPEGDAEKIRARVEALTLEMKPRTEAGAILITTMATLSVRMERAAEHETAAVAHRVRHAADDHDDERHDRADALFQTLGDDPRTALRKLKRTPEGVERLVDAWSDLLADLALDAWTDEQLGQAANLTGMRSRHARGTRLSALNRAIRGDFAALEAEDGAGLAPEPRQAWAKARLIDLIEAEVVALDRHYQTLDFETLAVDRDEAGRRALFDASKPATLARRYESEARRGFFKALKEFRQVEAEFAARDEAPTASSTADRSGSIMGSFRQNGAPPADEPSPADFEARLSQDRPIPGDQGQPLVYVPPVKTPG